MSNFTKIDDVVQYLQAHGYHGKDRTALISKRAVYDHIANGYLVREIDGTFSQKQVDQYAKDFLETDTRKKSKTEIQEAYNREKLRAIQLQIGIMTGELVPIEEEIKKRVAVIQGIKMGMIQSKASVMRELREIVRLNPPTGNIREAVIQITADLYVKAVHELFDDIDRRQTMVPAQ